MLALWRRFGACGAALLLNVANVIMLPIPMLSIVNLSRRLAKACAVLHVAPDALMCETPTRLDIICEAASVELGREMVKDEAQLRADYGLTLREIMRRLKASDAKSDGENDSGDNQETDYKGDSAEDAEKNEKKVVEP